MRKNMRVIQIRGIKGLLVALFVVCCLAAGFIIFPAFLTMQAWNYLAFRTGSFPVIDCYEGVLLWAIIILSVYLLNKRKFVVSFSSKQELTEEEVKEVVSRIKTQVMDNPMAPKDLSKEKTEEMQEVHSDKQ